MDRKDCDVEITELHLDTQESFSVNVFQYSVLAVHQQYFHSADDKRTS